jgi:hypothetical protein
MIAPSQFLWVMVLTFPAVADDQVAAGNAATQPVARTSLLSVWALLERAREALFA